MKKSKPTTYRPREMAMHQVTKNTSSSEEKSTYQRNIFSSTKQCHPIQLGQDLAPKGRSCGKFICSDPQQPTRMVLLLKMMTTMTTLSRVIQRDRSEKS
eukprot:scaffold685_cov114-Skeletonema_marinoi.AAC.2